MIKIPASELTNDALLGVIDAFILREVRTMDTEVYTLDEKRDRVESDAAKRNRRDPVYPENEHIDIVLTDASVS